MVDIDVDFMERLSTLDRALGFYKETGEEVGELAVIEVLGMAEKFFEFCISEDDYAPDNSEGWPTLIMGESSYTPTVEE